LRVGAFLAHTRNDGALEQSIRPALRRNALAPLDLD